jgi:hypothetical protein
MFLALVEFSWKMGEVCYHDIGVDNAMKNGGTREVLVTERNL